jgi:hypothetical protein
VCRLRYTALYVIGLSFDPDGYEGDYWYKAALLEVGVCVGVSVLVGSHHASPHTHPNVRCR